MSDLKIFPRRKKISGGKKGANIMRRTRTGVWYNIHMERVDLNSEEFKHFVKRMRQLYPSFAAEDFKFEDRCREVDVVKENATEELAIEEFKTRKKPKKKAHKTSKEIRERIKTRDGFRCTLCGETEGLEVHHIKHRSEGGDDSDNNLVTLCRRCHAMQHEGEPVYNLMKKNLTT